MDLQITTDRLTLSPLSPHDAVFILELTNTKGWLQFVGDRDIKIEEDANAYIQKMNANIDFQFWTVALLENGESIGLVSFMKKDYLEAHDIGFAFLPNYNGSGYAIEATKAVLKNRIEHDSHSTIIAELLPSNERSIKLLAKIGFVYQKELVKDEEILHIYQLDTRHFLEAEKMFDALKPKKSKDPLHGKTLLAIITELQEELGWEALAEVVPVNCFQHNPSIKSSLTFLRKTPWARKRVEDLWVKEIGNPIF